MGPDAGARSALRLRARSLRVTVRRGRPCRPEPQSVPAAGRWLLPVAAPVASRPGGLVALSHKAVPAAGFATRTNHVGPPARGLLGSALHGQPLVEFVALSH